FSSRRRHTRCLSDWSSDVCSSDLSRSSTLTDGHHTVTVSVGDWMGNVATKTWTFYVDDTILQKTRRPANTGPGLGGTGSGGPRKIGRASCRERVESAEWAGRGEEK